MKDTVLRKLFIIAGLVLIVLCVTGHLFVQDQYLTYGLFILGVFLIGLGIVFIKLTKMKKRNLIFGTCSVIAIALIIIAISYAEGVWIPQKVQWIVYPFQWKGNSYQLVLYFSSKSGIFSTGDIIHVHSILSYPNPTPDEMFLLYFPRSLEPQEYDKLAALRYNPEINNTSGSMTFSFPSYSFHKFNGPPMITDFYTVWTQEGFQEGVLQIMSTNASDARLQIVPTNDSSIFRLQFVNQTISKLAIYPLKNAIDIQPSEIKLQLKSSDNSLSMTYVVLAVSILAVGISLKQLWAENDRNNRNKPDNLDLKNHSDDRKHKKN